MLLHSTRMIDVTLYWTKQTPLIEAEVYSKLRCLNPFEGCVVIGTYGARESRDVHVPGP